MASGVYKILCLTNGRLYIGSAIDVARRFHRHRSDLRNDRHCCKPLQNAWNKYGEADFVFETLAEVDRPLLIATEQQFMDGYRAADAAFGFNIARIAGSPLGTKRSPEVRARMSAMRIGKRLSPEHCASISAGKIGNKSRIGVPHSNETKLKMSASQKGRKFTAAHRAALSANSRYRKNRSQINEAHT